MKNYPFFKIETRKYPKQYSKEGTIGILEERVGLDRSAKASNKKINYSLPDLESIDRIFI